MASMLFNMRLTEADQAALKRQQDRLGLSASEVFRTLLHEADGGTTMVIYNTPKPRGPDKIAVGHPAPAQVPVPAPDAPVRTSARSSTKITKTTATRKLEGHASLAGVDIQVGSSRKPAFGFGLKKR